MCLLGNSPFFLVERDRTPHTHHRREGTAGKRRKGEKGNAKEGK
jgi:hypothetical protein